MGLCIKFATTTEEIDATFRARHRAFVDEGRYTDPQPDGCLYDRFDAYPTSNNIIAVVDGHVIGGLRFTEISGVGHPASDYFDFAVHLPADADHVGVGSLLFVLEQYRGARIAFYLLGMGYYWALRREWSHIIGAVNPDVVGIHLNSGYCALADPLYNAEHRKAFVPVLLDMQNLASAYREFALAQRGTEYWVP